MCATGGDDASSPLTNRATVAAPMPLLPPVMTAVLPARSRMGAVGTSGATIGVLMRHLLRGLTITGGHATELLCTV